MVVDVVVRGGMEPLVLGGGEDVVGGAAVVGAKRISGSVVVEAVEGLVVVVSSGATTGTEGLDSSEFEI